MLEMAKYRASFNWLINNLKELKEEVGNNLEAVTDELQELCGFVQQYFQLIIITNRVQQTGQSLIILLDHMKAQLDMLSLGHLSPSIVTLGSLKKLLLKLQAELPHHLCLPVDPTEELGKYYTALGYVTLSEDKKLLVLASIPLSNRESLFEIYQVINLYIPYS